MSDTPNIGQVGAWRVDGDGRTLWSNAAFRGWTNDAPCGSVDAFDEHLTPEAAARFRAARAQSLTTERTLRLDVFGHSLDVTIDSTDEAAGTLIILQPVHTPTPADTSELLFGAPVEDLPPALVNRMSQILNQVVAFVGICNLDGVLLEANQPALDAANLQRADVIGKPFWDCYWWAFDAKVQDRLRDAVRRAGQGEIVRYDTPIRVGDQARLMIDFQIAPLRDSSGEIIELIPSAFDINERILMQDARELLLHELSHRVKNTLATVQSIAGHTARSASDTDAFLTTFRGRLRAVSECHDLLVETDHAAADMGELVQRQVAPYAGADTRLRLSGPTFSIPGELAHDISMVLHELATNAAKHGALSADGGHVSVVWRHDDQRLVLHWSEHGGPAVSEPTRRGFGSTLIARSLEHSHDATVTLNYKREGLKATFDIPLA